MSDTTVVALVGTGGIIFGHLTSVARDALKRRHDDRSMVSAVRSLNRLVRELRGDVEGLRRLPGEVGQLDERLDRFIERLVEAEAVLKVLVFGPQGKGGRRQ